MWQMPVTMSGGKLANLFQNPATMDSELFPAKNGILYNAALYTLLLSNFDAFLSILLFIPFMYIVGQ